jgi:quinol monooxygenase YgiN
MKSLHGKLIVAAILAAASLPSALAQVPAGQPAFAVTYIEVAPSGDAAAKDLLKQAAATSRKEAGNLRYEVLAQIERPNHFAIVEIWSDSKAFEIHGEAAATKQFRARLKPLQTGPYDERPSIGIAVGPIQATVTRGALHVLTHVDVTGAFKDPAIALLNKLADDSRKEPNSERFEVWQQGNRANHFTVSEIWKNEAAHEAHVLAAATREFREKLGTMTGALYDDRLYKIVE